MAYHIDLQRISLDQYSTRLKTAYLPPSRVMLRERTEERFNHLRELGIKNLNELIRFLKKKENVEELQKTAYFSGDYLKILLRELNSMLPKPNKISEFPGISDVDVEKMEKSGIKNTIQLYDRIVSLKKREDLSETTGIEASVILELTKLTDLSRIKWVSPVFARMLYDLGFDTVEKISKADPVVLHQKIIQINKERKIYKGQIGLNDIRILVDAAKEVLLEIEY